ncbi:glycoside hydrolase family protein [Marinomonas balearica]|uniref:Lysozyme n=1 Tax=Marinomonas balearica TaxID=491947 RepID=A0A4R6M5Q9_9GAMM|nr:glycoside hydrolase family protein [Marinomonas balearica]TDO96677.1 lysozyme [Marinomonas balearica]
MSLLSENAKLELSEQLIRHEGMKTTPYLCSAGKLTIGVGRNLMDNGINVDEALYLLSNDIDEVQSQLENHLPWISDLPENRKMVLINMAFNLGVGGLLTFKNMLAALKRHDLELVEHEMLDSLWAEQVGHRADELAAQMRES